MRPSLSIELITISPTPSFSACAATSAGARPVFTRPLCVQTSYFAPRCRAFTSSTTTTLWLPTASATCEIRPGFSIAAELIETFSNAQADDGLCLLCRLHAAAVAQRHPGLGRDVFDHAVVGSMAAHRRVDVQDHQLVDLLLVEDLDGVDRVADVFRLGESHGLDETFVSHQQAGNDPAVAARLQLCEVLQQPCAKVMALLGVKLHTEDVASTAPRS